MNAGAGSKSSLGASRPVLPPQPYIAWLLSPVTFLSRGSRMPFQPASDKVRIPSGNTQNLQGLALAIPILCSSDAGHGDTLTTGRLLSRPVHPLASFQLLALQDPGWTSALQGAFSETATTSLGLDKVLPLCQHSTLDSSLQTFSILHFMDSSASPNSWEKAHPPIPRPSMMGSRHGRNTA